MKLIYISFFVLAGIFSSQAQVGFGLTSSYDLYQYYDNPTDDTGESTSAGSALMNFGLGPKIWFGGNNFSFSVEAQASLGLFGLSVGDYKGLGAMSIPMMAKLNFGGLSTMDKEGKFGWSFGAGLQYTKTELYYLKDSFEEIGGNRDWFKTYVGQIGYGFGMSGFAVAGYLRGGYLSETEAFTGNFGIQLDFNLNKLKEIDDPASRL